MNFNLCILSKTDNLTYLISFSTGTWFLNNNNTRRTGTRMTQLFAVMRTVWPDTITDFPTAVRRQVVIHLWIFAFTTKTKISERNVIVKALTRRTPPTAICGYIQRFRHNEISDCTENQTMSVHKLMTG